MTLFLGCDHAGFETKNQIKDFIQGLPTPYEINDLGCFSDERVDYPDYADLVCQEVISSTQSDPNSLDPNSLNPNSPDTNSQSRGILICGSGQGMCMRANKFKEIRAALCWNEESSKLSREHNDANILCVGARMLDFSSIQQIIKAFLETPFAGGRHEARVQKINS